MSVTQLARKNIQELTPYQSARRLGGSGDIWLNANEYPISPNYHLTKHEFNRYPEAQPASVIDGYANYAGVKSENLIVSRGGDESIELLIRAFCEPQQDAVLYCPPTYGMYSVSAETCGIATKTVPLLSNFQLNLTEIKNNLDSVKVLFICSPNNPTGTLVDQNDLIELLEFTRERAVVVLDEAYIEFCPEQSMVKFLDQYPHLAIIRTLSKAFALAGLRCGFTIANSELINVLQKVIAPYPLPVPVSDIATQALQEKGLQEMRGRVTEIIANREQMKETLEKISIVEEIYASASNYLLVRFKDSPELFQYLWNKGIILRHQDSQLMLKNCIRITIGTAKENLATMQAITEFASKK